MVIGLARHAGVSTWLPLDEFDEASYDRMFGINVKGPFFLLQALLPIFANPASVILNASMFVHAGTPRSSRNGVVAKTMAAIGLKGGDQLLFGRTTVILAMVHTLLPLAIVTMLPVMNQIDRRLIMAASTLGANGSRAFWQVFFQPSIRGVASAGLLVLARLLHHPGTRRRREGHHDRAAYHSADQRTAELAARQRARGNSTDLDRYDLLRL